jgi:hypothetical protein
MTVARAVKKERWSAATTGNLKKLLHAALELTQKGPAVSPLKAAR